MSTISNALVKFFGVAVQGQTYLNAIYLLLAFPLGLFYFVFLVTGLSLGIGLLLLWVGLIVLVSVFAAWYGLAAFERWLAISLLGETIPPMSRQDLSNLTLWQKFVSTLKNPVTWKGLAYLFARFPLGVIIFTVFVTLAALSIALIAAPFYYNWIPAYPGIYLTLEGSTFFQPTWVIDTLPKALLTSLAGFFIGFVSLHIFNGLAWVSAKFARYMLGDFSSTPTLPQAALPAQPNTEALANLS